LVRCAKCGVWIPQNQSLTLRSGADTARPRVWKKRRRLTEHRKIPKDNRLAEEQRDD
jgi:hypothetical protein